MGRKRSGRLYKINVFVVTEYCDVCRRARDDVFRIFTSEKGVPDVVEVCARCLGYLAECARAIEADT